MCRFTIQTVLNESELAGPGNRLLNSAVTFFAAWGAHLTTRLDSVFRSRHAAAAVELALVVLGILGLRFSVSLAMVFVAVAILRFAWGWLDATCTTAVNEEVPVDGLRAAILSALSLPAGLLGMTSHAVFAFLGQSAKRMLVVLAMTAAAGTTLTVVVLVRHRRNDGIDLKSCDTQDRRLPARRSSAILQWMRAQASEPQRLSDISARHTHNFLATCVFRNIIGPQSVCSPWTLHSLIFPHSPHQGLPADVITS